MGNPSELSVRTHSEVGDAFISKLTLVRFGGEGVFAFWETGSPNRGRGKGVKAPNSPLILNGIAIMVEGRYPY